MRKKHLLNITIFVFFGLYGMLIPVSFKYFPKVYEVLNFPIRLITHFPYFITVPFFLLIFAVLAFSLLTQDSKAEKLKEKYEELKKQNHDYAFLKIGNKWLIVYEGESYYFNDLKGISYIAQLLAKPHKSIPSLQLAKQFSDRKLLSRSNVVEREDVGTDLDKPQDLVDDVTLRKCRKRLLEIDQELSVATRNEDQAAENRLEEERSQLLKNISMTTKPNGKSVSFQDSVQRARKAVRKAINSALKIIQKHNPSLYQHLSNSINTGTECTYKPENNIDWQL